MEPIHLSSKTDQDPVRRAQILNKVHQMSKTDQQSGSVSHASSNNVSAQVPNSGSHATYLMISPSENNGELSTAALTVQTKEEIIEALERSDLSEDHITAVVVEEEETGQVGQSLQSGSSSMTVGWSKAAVLKLIQLHKEHQHLFGDPHYKKKSVWEMVASCMQRNGCPYSWIQVENKWKAITKKYRDTVDYNVRHGHILHRKCPFYNELAAVYEYTSPCQNPQSKTSLDAFKPILANNNSYEQRTVAMVTTELPPIMKRPLEPESFPSSSSTSSSEVKTVLIKKKKYHPPASETTSDVGHVLQMLRVFNEDRQKQEQLRIERLEKMHQEKMTLFKEFLEILKESVRDSSAKRENNVCPGNIESSNGS